jgi:hypothetical protein
MFTKKSIEMIGIFKTQTPGNVGDAPIGVFEQRPRFV